ncbi:MAG: AMP-binding protein [Deltaproteobacteria bacterium]|nr:AMP-binding protein [Deltaproteobacteria bacterium]
MTDDFQSVYFADLIAHQAEVLGDKTYIHFEDEKISFAQYYKATCRAANGLADQGAKPGDGVAILMGNCPEYLYTFYGMPSGGFYTVPINVSLKGDGLQFILTNSDVKYLIVDDDLYPKVETFEKPIGNIEKIFVRRTTDVDLPQGTIGLEELFDASSENPGHTIKEGDISNLIYTSGTTGLPKGVVGRNRPGIGMYFQFIAASIFTQDNDILYTSLPLFHANALMLTSGWALGGGLTFGLDRKFSASRFWDRVRHYRATQFNAIGAMIPILMKQPEKENDADNPVRLVQSAACPESLWEKFEKRFNVTIWEGYGAVDGGGVSVSNAGDAPPGSVGKPAPNIVWKLVDDDGNEVPQGEIGELISEVTDKKTGGVEYYKNPEASAKKVQGGWIHSGDLFYADKDGNLYFVDRKSDSMRRRGENISSWEVENIVEKYEDAARCAAFGVPSELGEDEVMIRVEPKKGVTLDIKDLMKFCAEKMAYFMVPRYVDVVDEVPQTGTLRVMKAEMKKIGVTDQTWDREKEMPDLKLKK